MTKQSRFPRVPLFVFIHWSESGRFEENSLLSFADFERQARQVALYQNGRGYLKTKVTVLFADGETYQLRIDLAEHDEHGFRHAVQGRLYHWRSPEAAKPAGTMGKQWARMMEFLDGIHFEPA